MTLEIGCNQVVFAFYPLCSLSVLVVLGTGAEIEDMNSKFLHSPSSMGHAGIGWEVDSTPNACATYNLLSAEGRKVIGAFVIPGMEKK